MRAAEQLRENCARSTLQTLDLEAAFSSSRFTGPFLYYLASDSSRRRCERSSVHQIPIHAADPDRTRSCPHLMAGNGYLPIGTGLTRAQSRRMDVVSKAASTCEPGGPGKSLRNSSGHDI